MNKSNVLMFIQLVNFEHISIHDRKKISICSIAISIIFLAGFLPFTPIFESLYALDDNMSKLINNENGTLNSTAEKIFKVIVNVINNGNEDENGIITLTIDNKVVKSNTTNQITFLKGETTKFPIEYYPEQSPIGKILGVEIMYGGDEQERSVEAIVNQSGSTEPIQIYLFKPNDTNDFKSSPKVQITNKNSTDFTGDLQIRFDGTNLEEHIQAKISANEIKTFPMNFSSKFDLSGKDFTVNLSDNNTFHLTSHGIYYPGNDSEIASMTIN